MGLTLLRLLRTLILLKRNDLIPLGLIPIDRKTLFSLHVYDSQPITPAERLTCKLLGILAILGQKRGRTYLLSVDAVIVNFLSNFIIESKLKLTRLKVQQKYYRNVYVPDS
jgi:hypothetical protein